MMRLLIIDRDPHRQRQLRLILASVGSRPDNVHYAWDPRTVLGLLSKKSYDLVLIHFDLSTDLAFEAISNIRSKGLFSTRVIIYGAAPTRQHLEKALSAGASGFLIYPFTPADVEYAIVRHSSNRPVSKEPG